MKQKNDTSLSTIARQIISAWETVFVPRAWWLPNAEQPNTPPPAPEPVVREQKAKPAPKTTAKKKTPPPLAPVKRKAPHVSKPAHAAPAKPQPIIADAKHGKRVSAQPADKRELSTVEQGLLRLEQSMASFGLPPARHASSKRSAGAVSKTSQKSKAASRTGTTAKKAPRRSK